MIHNYNFAADFKLWYRSPANNHVMEWCSVSLSPQPKTLQIGNDQRASDLLDMALQEFGMPEDTRSDYQLWVQSGREDHLYPLIGEWCQLNPFST